MKILVGTENGLVKGNFCDFFTSVQVISVEEKQTIKVWGAQARGHEVDVLDWKLGEEEQTKVDYFFSHIYPCRYLWQNVAMRENQR